MAALGLGRVKTLPSSPMSAAGADLGTKGASWHVARHQCSSGESASHVEASMKPDHARSAFISGPMPMMFITRVRL